MGKFHIAEGDTNMNKFILLLVNVLSLLFIHTQETKVYGQAVGTPDNLTAIAGNGMVTLSWNPVSGATAYNVYLSRHPGITNSNYMTRAGMRIGNISSPYQLTGLNNGTTYYFVVTAENTSGESSPSNEVNATPQTASNSPVLFENISISAGLTQTSLPAFGIPLWGDINNDGFLDIVDPHHQRTISVYLNNGNETLTDITSTSGIYTSNAYDRHGITMGDYDNDGNLDLFIAMGSASGSSLQNSQLWKGDGTGNFQDVASAAGIQLTGARAAHWIDYDNDGDLDLFVSLEGGTYGRVYRNNGSGFFTDVTSSTGLTTGFNISMSFADYDNDGDMDLFSGGYGNDKLYRNNGNGTFSLTGSSFGTACRGIAWGDYNNDGFVDLYVGRGTNDYHRALYWDSSRIDFSFTQFPDPGEVTFRTSGQNITFNLNMSGMASQTANIHIGSAKTSPSSVPFTLSATAVTGTPVINAGQENGFFVWRDANNVWHIQWTQSSGGHGFWGNITSNGNFSQVTTNVTNILRNNFKSNLYRNNGDGTFTDVTEASRTGHIGNNSGVAWGDFDNDGWLDLYVVDAGDVLGNRLNTLYRNLGNGTFEDITIPAGVGAVSAVGRHYAGSWGDFNNDGTLDLLLANGFGWGFPASSGRSILYKNPPGNNHWIKLKLIGTSSNRSGIGARVVVNTSGGTQTRQMNGIGGELYSQALAPLHFGLGSVSVIDSISIIWPSGVVQTLNQVAADRELTIMEGTNPPTVNIVSPVNGASFSVFSDITIEATASNSDGTPVSKVEFFAGVTKIGEVTSAPYIVTWNPASAGSYTLTARATGDGGLTATSGGVNITVTNATNNDLVCYLAFDEGSGTIAFDSSGNGNNGTIKGATWTAGRIGTGLSFDGINDYVSLPRVNNDEISVAAWFYKNANDTTNGDTIFGARRWNTDIQLREGFELRFYQTTPNRLEFILVTQDGSGSKAQRTAIYNFPNSVGSWHHVAGTYNRTTGAQRLYVDGQLVSTVTHPAGNTVVPLAFHPDMRIGHARTNSYFNGVLDDVRLYNRALSEQEVQNLFNPDMTPPEVSATNPANNAIDVSTTSAITATFSEGMDASTITTATFTLSDGAGAITGTVNYSGTTATFTPSDALQYSTTYTATITTGVKDLAGNAMTADYTWSFTTGAAP